MHPSENFCSSALSTKVVSLLTALSAKTAAISASVVGIDILVPDQDDSKEDELVGMRGLEAVKDAVEYSKKANGKWFNEG